MKTEHTKGPWWLEDFPRDGEVPDGAHFAAILGKTSDTGLDFIIADVRGKPYGYYACAGEGEANARLIAAAPDLLEACKAVVREMKGRVHSSQCLAAVRLCDLAIAKATGQKAGV